MYCSDICDIYSSILEARSLELAAELFPGLELVLLPPPDFSLSAEPPSVSESSTLRGNELLNDSMLGD